MIYSLLGSCRRRGINPFDYLKDLFTRLPAAKITQINEFTPAAWAKSRVKVRQKHSMICREWRTTFAPVWRMFQTGDESGVVAK